MLQLLSLMTLALAANNPELAEAQTSQAKQLGTQQSTAIQAASKPAVDYAHLFTNSRDPADIKILRSGVKYKVLQEGRGESPFKTDFIQAKYTMSLVDGKVISSSERKDAPPLLEVAALPQGLQEAVQQMQPGSHWIIYIPAQLAYGSKGYKSLIPTNAPLIFDLSLISVKNLPSQEVSSVIDEFVEKD